MPANGAPSVPGAAHRPPPGAEPAPAPPAVPRQSLAERYAEMAHEVPHPRGVDIALRALDLTIAGGAALVLSPFMLLSVAAIGLTSGRPLLYRGSRVGRAGRVFEMYKFRTLRPDAETRLGPYLGDELTRLTRTEVTRVGKVLRFTHFDELPQLWNVLRGDMSVVGPRPIRPAFFEELCEQIPQYWQRLVVEPGITGFAQLRVTRETSWSEKLAHDLEYIADRSVPLYLRVCVATAWRILSSPVRALRAIGVERS
jgi:lipopolysaccharide/colanic/teichoic acid biosynthesis glycosyltransferase